MIKDNIRPVFPEIGEKFDFMQEIADIFFIKHCGPYLVAFFLGHLKSFSAFGPKMGNPATLTHTFAFFLPEWMCSLNTSCTE